MLAPPVRLTAADSALLVIDVQEKLLPAIPGTPRLLLNLSFLLDVAKAVDLPVLATEQYPKGLGATHHSLVERLPAQRPAKLGFSCVAVPETSAALAARPSVLLAGIEAHVCVLQTALDLMGRGSRVFLAVDAVASRHEMDRDTALRRLERAGAILTTVETAAFELVETAASPAFKTISALVQSRDRALREPAG